MYGIASAVAPTVSWHDSFVVPGVGRMREHRRHDSLLMGRGSFREPLHSGVPLLGSKVAAPPPPEIMLARERLFALLDAGAAGPVTVVAAPPGWGKTALLSAWAHERKPAWFTVESDDGVSGKSRGSDDGVSGDGGARFWSYLRAAVTSVTAHDELDIPAPPRQRDDTFLVRFAHALARLPRPVVVVLDDLHQVTDPAVLDGLDFLLRHAGERLRLVVGTRTEPALGLHRWRLGGGLTEIGAAELAFTPDEASALLARHGVHATPRQVDDLHFRTEGWPAGLRLAARGLRGHPDPDRFIGEFGGDHPSVSAYLSEEALNGQPAEARDLLMRTSIVERVSGELAEALTGRDDAASILADLEGTSAFVIRLSARPAAYRYHRMFADLLRAELRRHAPDQIVDLHRRAAAWHAAQGLPQDALRHALRGRDWGRATGLLAGHWPELVPFAPGRASGGSVPAPPPDAVRADPELALAYAAELLNLPDLSTADMYLRTAHQHRDRLPDDRKERFALVAAALRLAHAQLGGDRTQVLPAAQRLLELTRSPESDLRTRAVARTAVGVAELDAGDLLAAESTLVKGLADARRADLSRPRLTCASRLAAIRAVRGELRRAERTARSALTLSAYPGQPTADRCFAHLAMAVVALYRDRLDDAEAHLALAAPPRVPAPAPALVALVATTRARLLQSRGDLAASYAALAAARRELPPLPRVEAWLVAAEADLRTAHGDTGTARELLPDPAADDAMAVALARAHLRDGDPGAAARALPAWQRADSTCAAGVRVEAGLLDALAARRAGDRHRAARALELALDLAEPEGNRRAFVQAGADARALLAEHLEAGTAHWPLITELIAASDRGHPAIPEAPRATSDALTERELTVLRYLQSMLSNVEIAREMSLSVNTVKTHVRNIYRKLDATRRREAVRRGRELRLL
jgi:LuxR family maltose regulon positive regulatory protein